MTWIKLNVLDDSRQLVKYKDYMTESLQEKNAVSANYVGHTSQPKVVKH